MQYHDNTLLILLCTLKIFEWILSCQPWISQVSTKMNTDQCAGFSGHRADSALFFEPLVSILNLLENTALKSFHCIFFKLETKILFLLWCFYWYLSMLCWWKNYLSTSIQHFSLGQHSGNKCSLLLVTEQHSVVKLVSQLEPGNPSQHSHLHTFYFVFLC